MLVVAPAWTAVDGDHVIVAGLAAAPSWLRQMVPQALEAWYPSVPQALCRVHLSACSHSTWCLCFLTCLSAASRNHPITHPSSAPALRRLRGVWGFDLTRHSTHAAAALRRPHTPRSPPEGGSTGCGVWTRRSTHAAAALRREHGDSICREALLPAQLPSSQPCRACNSTFGLLSSDAVNPCNKWNHYDISPPLCHK